MSNYAKFRNIVEASKSNLTPEILSFGVNIGIRNAENTGNEHAAVGGSWKEYWKTFAQEDFPTTCPFCGEPLAEDDVDGCHVNVLIRDEGGECPFLGAVYYSRTSYLQYAVRE